MRISVDGSRIRNNKVAFSNLSGIVWTRPQCEEFVCEEFVCEDRIRVLVPLEICASMVDFIDDELAKCVNRRRAARGMISAKCKNLSPVFRTHFAMLQALHLFALLSGDIISNRYCC